VTELAAAWSWGSPPRSLPAVWMEAIIQRACNVIFRFDELDT
jgi:hypothetical protein